MAKKITKKKKEDSSMNKHAIAFNKELEKAAKEKK